MSQAIFDKIESEQFRKEPLKFNVGDTVRVHTKVVEGDKERIQVFAGIVIGMRGRGLNESFTVRRISYGEGVERVFPVNSPRVERVEVERQGKVRRAEASGVDEDARQRRRQRGDGRAGAPHEPDGGPRALPARRHTPGCDR